jgi:hypothetical protein
MTLLLLTDVPAREKVADGIPVPLATGGGPSPASTALLSVAI